MQARFRCRSTVGTNVQRCMPHVVATSPKLQIKLIWCWFAAQLGFVHVGHFWSVCDLADKLVGCLCDALVACMHKCGLTWSHMQARKQGREASMYAHVVLQTWRKKKQAFLCMYAYVENAQIEAISWGVFVWICTNWREINKAFCLCMHSCWHVCDIRFKKALGPSHT